MATYLFLVKRGLSPEKGGPRDKFYLWNESAETAEVALQKTKQNLEVKFAGDKLEFYASFEVKDERLIGSALSPYLTLFPYVTKTHLWELEDVGKWEFRCKNCGVTALPGRGTLPESGLCDEHLWLRR